MLFCVVIRIQSSDYQHLQFIAMLLRFIKVYQCGVVAKGLALKNFFILTEVPFFLKKRKFTLLKSPFVHRKALDQYQFCLKSGQLKVFCLDSQSFKTLKLGLALLMRVMPAGINMHVRFLKNRCIFL